MRHDGKMRDTFEGWMKEEGVWFYYPQFTTDGSHYTISIRDYLVFTYSSPDTAVSRATYSLPLDAKTDEEKQAWALATWRMS